MSGNFWFQHPSILVKDFELWPNEEMSFDRKLNAISRLIILLSLLGFLYTKNSHILIVGAITLGVIIFLHQQKSALNQKEGFTMKDIIPPTNSTFYKPNSKNRPYFYLRILSTACSKEPSIETLAVIFWGSNFTSLPS